jgi:hypothetical protein
MSAPGQAQIGDGLGAADGGGGAQARKGIPLASSRPSQGGPHQAVNPHWTREGCRFCHDTPGKKPKADVQALCQSCHDGLHAGREAHPVGRAATSPQTPVPKNWPLRDGKGSAYEGGLRVPLLVKAPGITRPGSVCNTPVITMDFFPTLLELAGADKAASRTGVDGVSFVPLLRGETSLPRQELFWHYPHYWNGGKVTPYSVARSGDWKLIRFYETGREELYNLNTDLSEQNNLAESNPARRQELGARLDAWLKQVGAQMPVPNPRLNPTNKPSSKPLSQPLSN